MIFYYSGCGNSAFVMRRLVSALEEQKQFIPKVDTTKPLTFSADEALGFVFPVYSWAPPKIVLDFISKLQFTNKPSYCYMVCTCGDQAGKTDVIFAKALQKKGIVLDAAFSVQMPETYINLPGFELDTSEGANKKIEAAKKRIPIIANRLKNRERGVRDVIVGNMAWFKSHPIKWLFYKFLITDKPFYATDACVGCGVCAANCPVENIKIVDGRPQWQGNCITCMSCYHRCPQHAIQFGKQTRNKGQYYLPENE